VVTVSNASGANKYYINGVQQPFIQLHEHQTYIFDLSDSSLIAPDVHPFRISATATGTAYPGITSTGTYGSSEKRTFVVPAGAPTTLYYYCTQHTNMGATMSVETTSEVVVSGHLDATTATLVTANVSTLTATTGVFTDDLIVDTDTLFVDVSASSVGIRTTTPAFNLDVHGTANTGAFTTTTATLTDNLSVGSNKLFVDVSASSVGIGTTSPAFNLDVHGTSNTGTFTATTATLTGDLIVDTDTLVVDVSESSVGIGTTLPAFKLDVHGTANTGAFTTTTATLTGDLIVDTDTLVVDVSASGVGIGTTLPAFKLDVHGTANVGAFTTTTATLTDNLIVDTDTLYVDTSVKCVGIETTTPHANLHVSGNVYVTEEITTSSNVNAVKVYSSEGMVINTGSVCKKFYGFDGTIANGATTAAAEIKLTFSSNIFYAKIVAHLVEDSTEFSNMSLEVGGGSRLGGTNPDLKLGSVSVFGNTSTNPWNSTPILGASTIIIKPSADINSGGGTSTNPALYNLFIEYITPDATNGVLSTIQLGSSIVKQFDY
jgi:hypothetical protein